MMEIKPQEGPQEAYLSTPADIAIYGGAAGGGKTFASVLEPLHYTHVPGFRAVVFRRTSPQITAAGSIWDEASGIYPLLGAKGKTSPRHEYTFPEGSRVTFAHLQYEKDVYDYQSSQICLCIFEELTHFTEKQFFYMLSRNRSTCGVRPYMRATCNPDPDSFVANLIQWWWDEETGYPIPERSGVIRHFARRNDDLVWGDTEQDVLDQFPGVPRNEIGIKSFTFIASSLSDNKILLEKDPTYLQSLNALPLVEREQLLKGNWRIKPAPGLYFKKHYFEIVDQAPILVRQSRGWDLAATDKDEKGKAKQADHTASVKMGVGVDGFVYILDMTYGQMSPAKVKRRVKATASQDGKECVIRIAQDPAQAGKDQSYEYAKMLQGYFFQARPITKGKVERAWALSSASENGLVKVVRGSWNDTFFNHAEAFPPEKKSPDIIDSAVEAYDELINGKSRGFFIN